MNVSDPADPWNTTTSATKPVKLGDPVRIIVLTASIWFSGCNSILSVLLSLSALAPNLDCVPFPVKLNIWSVSLESSKSTSPMLCDTSLVFTRHCSRVLLFCTFLKL